MEVTRRQGRRRKETTGWP